MKIERRECTRFAVSLQDKHFRYEKEARSKHNRASVEGPDPAI
jgi:hypothetical protein